MRALAYPASLVLALTITLGSALWYLNSPPPLMEEKTIIVKRGQSPRQTGKQLVSDNLIRNEYFFYLAGRVPGAGVIKSGTYRIYPGMTSMAIYRKFSNSAVETVSVTIPEGHNLYDIAEILEKHRVCPARDFLALALSRKHAEQAGITAPTFEGYLYPDTYRFTENRDPRDVIKLLHGTMKRVLSENGISAGGRELNDLLSMASLIETEAKVRGEQVIISSVFHNRLSKNMRMDCDPTVRYAVKRFSGPIRASDLASDSPYNTYRHKGLPPGPICSPGLPAILAAKKPAETPYLYFVARNDGSHYFSSTMAEHGRAVDFYQRGKKNGFVDRQNRFR